MDVVGQCGMGGNCGEWFVKNEMVFLSAWDWGGGGVMGVLVLSFLLDMCKRISSRIGWCG